VVGFVKCRDLLVPFVSESRERGDIVLNVPCKYYACRCERLAYLASPCKVIFDLIHMYVFWFIKILVWSSQDFALHVLVSVKKK
jgi:hypothetical protein